MLLGLTATPQKGDKAGCFCGQPFPICGLTPPIAFREISRLVVEIDRAMKLGFNWELGPFELWDAAGVEATVDRMKTKDNRSQRTQKACSPPEISRGIADDPKAASAAPISI